MAPDVTSLAVVEQPSGTLHGMARLLDQGAIQYQDPAPLDPSVPFQSDIVQ